MKMEKICRTCLKVSESLCNLFDDTELPHKIKTISSVQVSLADNLPSKVCSQCVRNIHLLYDFRSIIIRSNIILKNRYSSTLKNEDSIDLNSTTTDFFTFTVKSEHSPVDQEIVTEVNVDTKEESVNHLKEVDSDNHIKSTNTEVVKEMSRVRRYTCKFCKFSCTEYTQLRNHKRKHITTCRKSVCSICGKTVRSENLKKHISIHTEAPVTCKDCGKTCKNTESLRGHALIHRNIKFQCNTCGKVYKYRAGFAAHLKRHALGDVKTIACRICSKLFYDNRVLEKHIRSHTGERPYPCEYCKKGFSSSYALKTHKRQHTNEKPYACELCPLAFHQKVSLRTHIKSKHPETAIQHNT